MDELNGSVDGALVQAGQQYDFLEDIVCPNYNAELQGLWSEIKGFIESFSGEEKNSNSLIAMLQSLCDLGTIFGAEESEFLISQCIRHNVISWRSFKLDSS